MRRSFAAAAAVIALAPIWASGAVRSGAASSATPGRVVLVTLDGTRLSDWLPSPGTPLPAVGAMLREGAVGLLSTRTASVEGEALRAREAAYRTFGAGRRAASADASALASVLGRADIPIAALGSAIGEDAADRMVALVGTGRSAPVADRDDEEFPTGRRTDYPALQHAVSEELALARVLVVDTGDTARIDRALGDDAPQRDRWMRSAVASADAFVGWLRRQLSPDDVLILASLTPPRERREHRVFVSAIAVSGGGFDAGLLTSGTTRRDGVVSIIDLAPTILTSVGRHAPPEMTGTPIRTLAAERALTTLRRLEADLVHASRVRSPLLRGTLGAAMALVVVSVVAVASARGGRRGRFALRTALLALAAVPLTLFVEPAFGVASTADAAITVFALAAGLAVLAHFLLGGDRAAASIAALTLGAVLGDLVLGGPLASRSPLGFLVAEGARFHGIGNETMGVVVASALLVASWAVDRSRSRRTAAIVAIVFLVTAGLMAAPGAGAKFGSIPVAVAGFGGFALLALGRRLGLREALGLAIATILLAGLVIAIDALRSPEAQSHISRALGGSSEVLGRKIGAAERLLAFSIWMSATVVIAGSAGLLAWRRSAVVARGLWGRPALRSALGAAAVAGLAAIAFNDAGVTAAALLALLGATRFLGELVVPDDEASPVSRPGPRGS